MDILIIALIVGVLTTILYGQQRNASCVICPVGLASGVCGAYLGVKLASFYNVYVGDLLFTNLLTGTVGAYLLVMTMRRLRA